MVRWIKTSFKRTKQQLNLSILSAVKNWQQINFHKFHRFIAWWERAESQDRVYVCQQTLRPRSLRATVVLQGVCPNLGRKTIGFYLLIPTDLSLSLTQSFPESNEKFELIRLVWTSRDLETSFPEDRGEPHFFCHQLRTHWVPAPTLPGSQLFRSIQKLQRKVTSPAFWLASNALNCYRKKREKEILK